MTWGVNLWRVLPGLLTAERRDVEIAPNGPHGLVSATVDEIGAELFVAIPEEYVVTTPLIDAEIFVEVIRHGVQGDSFTTHPCLETLDVLPWSSRGVLSGAFRCARMADLIGAPPSPLATPDLVHTGNENKN